MMNFMTWVKGNKTESFLGFTARKETSFSRTVKTHGLVYDTMVIAGKLTLQWDVSKPSFQRYIMAKSRDCIQLRNKMADDVFSSHSYQRKKS
jgi:hypothetical protein